MDPFSLIAAGVGVVGGLIGGKKKADAAASKAKAHNKAVEAKYNYDKEGWEMSKDRLEADYAYALQSTQISRLNENKTARYQDSLNLQRYNYDLQIRNAEQDSLNEQYTRSEKVYQTQMSFNTLAANAGREDEYRKLREIKTQAQFQSQDNYVQKLITTGQGAALGLSGKSAEKAMQSRTAKYARTMASINESLDSAGRSTHAILKEIARDKLSADLSAYANRMSHPGEIPLPMIPFKTPVAIFQDPRELDDYDFGPKPIRGAKQSQAAARNQAWGETWSGIAGDVGSTVSGGLSLSGLGKTDSSLELFQGDALLPGSSASIA